MDLFNPYVEYNYTIKIMNLDISKYENPYIQVIWEDFTENFTQEKVKSIKHYFQKKYNTNNVNLITKTKISDDSVESNVDISFNILDENYQLDLIKSYLKTKYDERLIGKIIELNSVVDNQLTATNTDVIPFKKWFIKNIEFSNFLSYGENQKLDFEKCSGINVVESNPPNFGGKCIRYDTEIDVEFNVDEIINKLGFLPNELK
jgi:hypothetical protein